MLLASAPCLKPVFILINSRLRGKDDRGGGVVK